MYNLSDLLIYKKEVCKVSEIKEKYIKDIDYYVLIPLTDRSLKIQIRTTSKAIRNIITK